MTKLRPKSVRCEECGGWASVAKTGPIPRFCSPRCRGANFRHTLVVESPTACRDGLWELARRMLREAGAAGIRPIDLTLARPPEYARFPRDRAAASRMLSYLARRGEVSHERYGPYILKEFATPPAPMASTK